MHGTHSPRDYSDRTILSVEDMQSAQTAGRLESYHVLKTDVQVLTLSHDTWRARAPSLPSRVALFRLHWCSDPNTPKVRNLVAARWPSGSASRVAARRLTKLSKFFQTTDRSNFCPLLSLPPIIWTARAAWISAPHWRDRATSVGLFLWNGIAGRHHVYLRVLYLKV